jgi:hypothetical protein
LLEKFQVLLAREVLPVRPVVKGRILSRFLRKGMTQASVMGILGSPQMVEGHGPLIGGAVIYDYLDYELFVIFTVERNGAFLDDVQP